MLRRPLLGMLAALAAPPSFALYDPPPNDLLKHMPGSWRGALTYRDWSKPERLVTLPCHMHASLLTPVALSLYFVFDDGPGKTVYSYDRWLFDFETRELTWVSGTSKSEESVYRIISASTSAEGSSFVLSRTAQERNYRQRLVASARSLTISKVEIDADGREVFRNGYELSRADA